MKNVKIAIVGASIAGSAVAIMLDRAGYDITIFEQQPKGAMSDRGAGIALPKDLVKKLIELDMFDQHFSNINVDNRLFFTYDGKDERLLTVKPFLASSVHWCNVYRSLNKRIPDAKTHYSTRITDVKQNNKAKLTFIQNNQTHEEEFDIVIFADGFHSVGRQYLFPESKLEYTNYIAWRGTEGKITEEASKRLKDNVPFYLYEKGHLLIFKIPLLDSDDRTKEYLVNWLVYEKVEGDHPLLRDKKSQDNIPPPAMKPEYIEYLHNLARKYFPSFPQEIILETPNPFTQAIYDAWVPQFSSKHIILLGDASILLRPHVGAGSTKALMDVLSLDKHLRSNPDIYSALENWGKERQQMANNLYKLCRDLGKFLVSDVPDWNSMDSKTMDNTWENMMAEHRYWYQINPEFKQFLK